MIDLNKIKAELEAKRIELESREDAVENHLSQPAESDRDDNATLTKDDEVLSKIGDATLSELHEVKLALERLEHGQYGTCTTCGNQISEERLQALPYATQCMNCA